MGRTSVRSDIEHLVALALRHSRSGLVPSQSGPILAEAAGWHRSALEASFVEVGAHDDTDPTIRQRAAGALGHALSLIGR